MPLFNERIKPNTTLKVRASHVPQVFISETAINKMSVYVDEAPGSDEIGWLGTAFRQGKEFFIEDVFLFKQEVHGTTTEITPQGLQDFAEELLTQPDGVEIWNNLKMWGHSHVNMGISPSAQDNSQMEAFSEIGHDFFIRLICNKQGELGVDVYDYEAGLEFHNSPWETYVNEEDAVADEIANQVELLKRQLMEIEETAEVYRQSKIKAIAEPIKAEIKEKVSKLVYTSHYTKPSKYSNWGNQSYANTINSAYTDVTDDEYNYTEDNFSPVSVIDGVKGTVYDYYTVHDLNQLANTCFTLDHFLEDAILDGMNEMLSLEDLKKVWNKIMEMQDSKWGYDNNSHGYGY